MSKTAERRTAVAVTKIKVSSSSLSNSRDGVGSDGDLFSPISFRRLLKRSKLSPVSIPRAWFKGGFELTCP